MTKMCMCRKKAVGNMGCSQEHVACGSVCVGMWEAAETVVCGKLQKLWCVLLLSVIPHIQNLIFSVSTVFHCTTLAHNRATGATCDETMPCMVVIMVAYLCGRIQQPMQCGKSMGSPTGHESQQLCCSAKCAVATHNTRLADVLGISAESHGTVPLAVWADDVRMFACTNTKFLGVVEKVFVEFVASEKKMQVLPHMLPERRKFVYNVSLM
ncbi:hypothetical protein B0H10DRAFT_2214441 [Mycena sp. CBHHK59/15]|nr:hypothetical protein B0H10DRAFT_2214441 [Mycena sp. CBHHK59/15]